MGVTAWRGFGFIYHTMTVGLSDEQRDEVDAQLGDVDARARVNERTTDMLIEAGGEVH
jgi:hypothetical protein